jgi:DNA-binding MarR family transcriptional regulator
MASGLDAHLYYLIERTSRTLNRLYEPRCGALSLTPNDLLIMDALYERDGVTASFLADKLGFEATTMVRIIGRMLRAGLLERIDDPSDKRAQRLFLRKEARRQIKTWLSEAEKLNDEVTNRLTDEERETFTSLLAKLDVLPLAKSAHGHSGKG